MRGVTPFLRHLIRRQWPPLGRTHKILFLVTALFYAAVVAGVLSTSRLVQLDWHVVLQRPYEQWPHAHGLLDTFVIAGQRGPAGLAALAWLGWRAWRSRSWRPVLVLLVALALLNMTVGAVKLGTGRLGPHYTDAVGSAELFRGGLIFPSGHTANGVVTWGTVAYLATRHRRASAVVAGVAAFAIGLTTVYLGTHWVSDVLGGWAAGVLVLLALPLFEPLVATMDKRITVFWAGCHAVPALLRAASLVGAASALDARSPIVGVAGCRRHRIGATLPRWRAHGATASRAPIAARAPPLLRLRPWGFGSGALPVGRRAGIRRPTTTPYGSRWSAQAAPGAHLSEVRVPVSTSARKGPAINNGEHQWRFEF